MEYSRRGSTLAEVALGVAVFALFILGLLGVLGRSVHLGRRGREIEQAHQLTQSVLEQAVARAREAEGYRTLASRPLTVSPDPDYLYAMDVSEVQSGLRQITVALYHHDPGGSALALDPDRPRQGLALCLGTLVEQP